MAAVWKTAPWSVDKVQTTVFGGWREDPIKRELDGVSVTATLWRPRPRSGSYSTTKYLIVMENDQNRVEQSSAVTV